MAKTFYYIHFHYTFHNNNSHQSVSTNLSRTFKHLTLGANFKKVYLNKYIFSWNTSISSKTYYISFFKHISYSTRFLQSNLMQAGLILSCPDTQPSNFYQSIELSIYLFIMLFIWGIGVTCLTFLHTKNHVYHHVNHCTNCQAIQCWSKTFISLIVNPCRRRR